MVRAHQVQKAATAYRRGNHSSNTTNDKQYGGLLKLYVGADRVRKLDDEGAEKAIQYDDQEPASYEQWEAAELELEQSHRTLLWPRARGPAGAAPPADKAWERRAAQLQERAANYERLQAEGDEFALGIGSAVVPAITDASNSRAPPPPPPPDAPSESGEETPNASSSSDSSNMSSS